MKKWKKQKNQTQGKWYCSHLIFLFMQNFHPYSLFIIFKQTNVLDAFSHLYKRVCPSVGLSVGRSVTHELKTWKKAFLEQVQSKERLAHKNRYYNRHENASLVWPPSDLFSWKGRTLLFQQKAFITVIIYVRFAQKLVQILVTMLPSGIQSRRFAKWQTDAQYKQRFWVVKIRWFLL